MVSDDDDETEVQMMAQLSKKEKRRLLRYNHLCKCDVLKNNCDIHVSRLSKFLQYKVSCTEQACACTVLQQEIFSDKIHKNLPHMVLGMPTHTT